MAVGMAVFFSANCPPRADDSKVFGISVDAMRDGASGRFVPIRRKVRIYRINAMLHLHFLPFRNWSRSGGRRSGQTVAPCYFMLKYAVSALFLSLCRRGLEKFCFLCIRKTFFKTF